MARRSIAGKRALVTGASGGIGRALALELARQGADVACVARRGEQLSEVAREIESLGRKAVAVTGDVTVAAVRELCLERASAELGGLDILVNNAGMGAIGPFAAGARETLRQVFEVNFFALAELTRLAVPILERGREPIIVNVGSILGHRAIPLMSEYCASKFAVRGFSDALRAELRPRGIDVLVVSPASTESEFFSHLAGGPAKPAWRARKPLTAEAVACATLAAIRRGSAEVVPGLPAKAVYWVNRLAPWLVERILARRHS